MTVVHWAHSINGTFGNPADWSSGIVPDAADDAFIDSTGAFTVSSSSNESVSSIVTASGATLDIDANLFVAANGTGPGANAGTIEVDASAALKLSGTVDNVGNINLNTGSSLVIIGNLTFLGSGHINFLLPDLYNGAQPFNAVVSSGLPYTVTNVNNTISGNGYFGFPIGAYNNSYFFTLINDAAGTIDGEFRDDEINVINYGHISAERSGIIFGGLTNSGTVEAHNSNLSIQSGINNGVITVSNGQLAFDDIGGNGTLTIDGGRFWFGSTSNNVYVGSTSSTPLAILGNAIITTYLIDGGESNITGTISGFGPHDAIITSGVISGLKYTPNISNTAGILQYTIAEAGGTNFQQTLSLSGTYSASGFQITDGWITYSSAPNTTYVITPLAPTISENQGAAIFTITRSNTSQSEIIYISTLQDQGSSNPGNEFYGEILNRAVPFGVNQSSASVPLTINEAHLTSGTEAFRIVARDAQGNILADTDFRISNNDIPSGPSGVDPYIPLVPTPAQPTTAADIVKAAKQYVGSLWAWDNCTGLVWAVAKSAGANFYDATTQLIGTPGHQQSVADPDVGYFIPHGPGHSGAWVTIATSSSTPNWQSIVQPGDLVRIPSQELPDDPAGHSFIVVERNPQNLTQWEVIDNTDPNHQKGDFAPVTISEHSFNANPNSIFEKEILGASVVFISRLAGAPNSFVSGKTGDGYIANATIFLDGNSNGVLDDGEFSTLSDANGNFTLPAGSQNVVAFGGVDISTGLPFQGDLLAPANSSLVTPLTTLLTIQEENGIGVAQGQQKILSAFGLTASIDLTTFDPIAGTEEGDSVSAAIYLIGAKVLDTVEMIAATFEGLGVGAGTAVHDAFLAIVNTVDTLGTGAALNLDNQGTIEGLINTVAQIVGGINIGEAVGKIADVISASNAALDQNTQSDQVGASFLTDSAAVQRVAQGVTVTSLQSSGTDPTQAAQIENSFTGGSLGTAITKAASEIAALPPIVQIDAYAGITSEAAQIISGTVDLSDVGNVVTVFDNGFPVVSAIAGEDGTWSAQLTLIGNGRHALTAQDTNAAGNTGTSNAVIFTLDNIAPTVTTVIATTDTGTNSINAGHLVTINMGVSNAVTVSGSPTLSLDVNTMGLATPEISEVATYVGGSGTNTLTFAYVTQTGDSSSDLQMTGLTLPNGASIADGAGNALTGLITSSDLGIQVDAPATTTILQEINGLYVTVFGVPATGPGVTYWSGEVVKHDPSMAALDPTKTPISTPDAQALSLEMVQSAQQQIDFFHAQYDGMTDDAYVAGLYSNIGGTGITNAGALGYWLGRLQSIEQTLGTADHSIAARASVAGEFVQALIASDVNLGAAYWGLNAADFAAAQADQQSFLNKVALSQVYAAATGLPSGALLNYSTESGPAWDAAKTVLAGITTNPATVSVGITGINNVVAHQDLSLI